MDDDAVWMRGLAAMDVAPLEQLATSDCTLKVAAAREFLSLRTAYRRVAVLRQPARVESTKDFGDGLTGDPQAWVEDISGARIVLGLPGPSC